MKVQLETPLKFLMVFALLSPVFQAQTTEQRLGKQLDRKVAGTLWKGPPGIVETTAQIMARDAQRKAVERMQPGAFQQARLPAHRLPDRRHLPQNPDSSRVASWPPREATAASRIDDDLRLVAPVQTSLSFDTFDSDPTLGPFPPNPAGAVGPTQFLMANDSIIESFDKASGQPDSQINASLDAFFASVSNNYGALEPHIRYDRFSGDWLVTAINTDVPNRILIAVSNGSSITSATPWTFFYYGIGTSLFWANCFVDNPSLGSDVNALYIGGDLFCGTGSQFEYGGAFYMAVQRSSLVGGGPLVAYPSSSTDGALTPQGVDNYDPNATVGYLIGTSLDYSNGLVLVTVSFSNSGPLYNQSTVTIPVTGLPLPVQALGSTVDIDPVDDRLTMAHYRSGSLWTAHAIGVDFTGSADFTSLDRNALRWYQLNVQTFNSNTSTSVTQWGTVFDPSLSNPLNYWIPSLVVSGPGNVLMGSSVAGANSYINAAFTLRLSSDPAGQMNTPAAYTSSNTVFNPSNDYDSVTNTLLWGVYSSTSLDPEDDMTMWTAQQYCSGTNIYGLQVLRFPAPRPASLSASPSVAPGQAGAEITVTGKGFYDPGPGFPNRLSVAITGGVTVNSVTYVNSTTLLLSISTVAATLGAHDVTVTNPDGQSGTGTGILQVSTSGCAFSIAPSSQPVPAQSGSGSVTVTAGAGCPWTASSNSGFVTITSGATGIGNGTVNYSVGANPTASARNGTLAIAGLVFTVNQSGLIPTSVSLSASTNPIPFGQTLTLTATVTPSTASGTIAFMDGPLTLATVTLAGGQATFTTTLPIGTRSLQANYSGDTYNVPSSAAITLIVSEPLNWPRITASSALTGSMVAVGDFNGDGKADLAAFDNSGNVLLLLGNGDGTFRPSAGPQITGSVASLAVADLNGDGKADLAVINCHPCSYGEFNYFVAVVLGNGDGTFQAPVNYQTIENANYVAVADLNGDGKTDLVVSGTNYVSVLLGNGDGTFRPDINYLEEGSPGFFAFADFNLDGKPDLAVGVTGTMSNGNGLGIGPSYLSVWLNSGNPSTPFSQPLQNYTGAIIATGDFNGDGKPDMAVANGTGVSVLPGNGDGTFQPGVFYSTGNTYASSLAVADFNGDGKLDLAVANINENTISILPGNGDGTFQAPINYRVLSPRTLTVGDFNGDGRSDLAVTSTSAGTLTILLSASPQLMVASSHSGNFQQGQIGATYSIAVANSGTASSSGTVTVTDSLPAGLTVTAIAGGGWTCTQNPLSCSRADALAPNASYPAITVTVNVANNAPASLTNTATVSFGGKVNSASDATTVTPVSLVYANLSVAKPGTTAQIPVTLALPAGVSLDSLSFTITLTPVASATTLTGTLSFVAAASQPVPASNATASSITLTYSGPIPTLSGSLQLGTVTVTIPNLASAGQIYTVHVSVVSASLAGNAVTVAPGLDANLVAGVPYLVGDVFPSTSDSDGNFGDSVLNTLDLIALLRAVTRIPGLVPATCSDRFDAMDTFPVDTPSTRGGDGTLNTLDLIALLKRVTIIDTSLPTRLPRGLPCSSAAAPQRRALATPRQPEARLELVAENGGTAVYFSSTSTLSLSGLAFSLAASRTTPLRFVSGDQPPSLVDTGVAGNLALAWLDSFAIGGGQRVFLGRIEGVAPAALRLAGVSANSLEDGHDVVIDLGAR